MRKAEKSVKSGRCLVSGTELSTDAVTARSAATFSTGETASVDREPATSFPAVVPGSVALESDSQQHDCMAGGGVSPSWHPCRDSAGRGMPVTQRT